MDVFVENKITTTEKKTPLLFSLFQLSFVLSFRPNVFCFCRARWLLASFSIVIVCSRGHLTEERRQKSSRKVNKHWRKQRQLWLSCNGKCVRFNIEHWNGPRHALHNTTQHSTDSQKMTKATVRTYLYCHCLHIHLWWVQLPAVADHHWLCRSLHKLGVCNLSCPPAWWLTSYAIDYIQ